MDGFVEVNDVDERSCMLVELLHWVLDRDPEISATVQQRISRGIERFYREPQVLPNAEAVVEFVRYPGVCNKGGEVVEAKTAREANEWLERWLERQVRARKAARATK